MTMEKHGGGVTRLARELGVPLTSLLDFSASINPLGMPAAVRAAALEALEEAIHYPEIDGASLREALAGHHRLPAEYLIPGAGSTELIYLLPRVLRPRRALLVSPAFSEYTRSLEQAGCAIDLHPLAAESDFAFVPQQLLAAVTAETDLILLANPGNPTGVGIAPALVEELSHAVREQALVLVDEAFVDFAPELSVINRVQDHANLYVLRSLTKFYAIPGLRAGYLAGPPRGVARLAAGREPWTLSTPALAAARACLAAEEFRRATLAQLPGLRGDLAAGLAGLGLTVFPGAANYLLARLETPARTAAGLAERLLPLGILIRDCANFHPLDQRYLRVAVRSVADNARLLAALAALLGP